MMNDRWFIFGMVALFVVLGDFGKGEVLPKADGKVSAVKLPLDARLAKAKYETATFGLG